MGSIIHDCRPKHHRCSDKAGIFQSPIWDQQPLVLLRHLGGVSSHARWERHRMKPIAADVTTRSLARWYWVVWLLNISDWKMWPTTTVSNTLWLPTWRTSPAGRPDSDCQRCNETLMYLSTAMQGCFAECAYVECYSRVTSSIIEKNRWCKLDNASTPKPHDHTGRLAWLACIHLSSVQILVTAERNKSSNFVRSERPQQGEE